MRTDVTMWRFTCTMLAANLETLLFFLLMAGVGLLRLLVKKAGGETADADPAEPPPPRTAPPLPRPAIEGDEERIRKFLEALGQPTTSVPPRRVTPRSQIPPAPKPTVVRHLPPVGSPLPPLTTRPAALPRRIRLPGEITTPPFDEKQFVPAPPE